MKKKWLFTLVTFLFLCLIGCSNSTTSEIPTTEPAKEPVVTVAPIITEVPETAPEEEIVITPAEVPTEQEAPAETVVPTEAPAEATAPTEVPATPTPPPTVVATPTAVPVTPTPTAMPATPTPTEASAPDSAKVLSRVPLTGLDRDEIVDKIILGWNLGNTLESTNNAAKYNASPATFVTAWGNEEPTQEVFDAVKAAGFNAVRIPVTWYQKTYYDAATDTYVINPEWMAYVKKTVDYAYYSGLFVILNTHHEHWIETSEYTDETYATASKMMKDIWTQVAEAFADYDQGLIFEGLNEPRRVGASDEWSNGTANDWEYLNKLEKIFIDTVRGQGSVANKERLLMLTGYSAGATCLDAINAIEIPANAGNVAISIHAYSPYEFCMTGENPANFHFPGTSEWGRNYEADLNWMFSNLKRIAEEKNVRFILGEYGSSDNNNPEDRARWATYYLSLAKDAGIPCFVWDNQGRENYSAGDRFGLLHRKSATWHESCIPMLQAMMKVYGQPSSLPKYVAPVRTAFSWKNIPVENNWIQLYRSESGEKLDAWAPVWINNWKPYLNDNYKIVVVYDSGAQPTLVLQGGWHHIRSSEDAGTPYLLSFSMDDVNLTLERENIKLGDMTGFFASAGSQPMTLYGVYAVPVK